MRTHGGKRGQGFEEEGNSHHEREGIQGAGEQSFHKAQTNGNYVGNGVGCDHLYLCGRIGNVK